MVLVKFNMVERISRREFLSESVKFVLGYQVLPLLNTVIFQPISRVDFENDTTHTLTELEAATSPTEVIDQVAAVLEEFGQNNNLLYSQKMFLDEFSPHSSEPEARQNRQILDRTFHEVQNGGCGVGQLIYNFLKGANKDVLGQHLKNYKFWWSPVDLNTDLQQKKGWARFELGDNDQLFQLRRLVNASRILLNTDGYAAQKQLFVKSGVESINQSGFYASYKQWDNPGLRRLIKGINQSLPLAFYGIRNLNFSRTQAGPNYVFADYNSREQSLDMGSFDTRGVHSSLDLVVFMHELLHRFDPNATVASDLAAFHPQDVVRLLNAYVSMFSDFYARFDNELSPNNLNHLLHCGAFPMEPYTQVVINDDTSLSQSSKMLAAMAFIHKFAGQRADFNIPNISDLNALINKSPLSYKALVHRHLQMNTVWSLDERIPRDLFTCFYYARQLYIKQAINLNQYPDLYQAYLLLKSAVEDGLIHAMTGPIGVYVFTPWQNLTMKVPVDTKIQQTIGNLHRQQQPPVVVAMAQEFLTHAADAQRAKAKMLGADTTGKVSSTQDLNIIFPMIAQSV